MVFLPPLPSLPFASLTLSSGAAVRQRWRQPENFSHAAVADSREPLGLDERPTATARHAEGGVVGAARLAGAQHMTDNNR